MRRPFEGLSNNKKNNEFESTPKFWELINNLGFYWRIVMDRLTLIIRTVLFLFFMVLVFCMMDFLLVIGADFLLSLKWIWFLIILIFLKGLIWRFYATLIAYAVFGISSLFKPHPGATFMIMQVLSILNFLYLTYSLWTFGDFSFFIIIGKLIATVIIFDINRMMAMIGLMIKKNDELDRY